MLVFTKILIGDHCGVEQISRSLGLLMVVNVSFTGLRDDCKVLCYFLGKRFYFELVSVTSFLFEASSTRYHPVVA